MDAVAANSRRRASMSGLALIAVASLVLSGTARADDDQPSSSMWDFLRAKYYGDKVMGVVDEAYMSIEAPANTPDPAATPLTLHFADDPGARIKRARVFIDNNPSPLVATFEFGDTALTQIDMHVRIDRFTSVRVVAEKADGGLEMRSVWVKAAGGCSAPSTQAAGGELGEMRLRAGQDSHSLLLSIRHPNSSGFQIDPRTGDNIPAHYISHIRVNAGGTMLIDAETGISVSENPTLRIASDKSLAAPLVVDATDSVTQAHFTASTAAETSRTAGVAVPAAGHGDR